MTPREKLIEKVADIVSNKLPRYDAWTYNNVAEAIIDYLKLEVVDIKGCGIKQYSDQMHCKLCGLTYDVNDPNEPLCKLENTKPTTTTIINIDNL